MSEIRPVLPAWASKAVVVLLSAAVVLMIGALVKQNRDLRSALSGSGSSSGLPQGAALRDIRVQLDSMDGRRLPFTEALKIGERPGVIALMTTTCRYCEATLPFWDELAGLDRERISFVGLSLDSVEATRAYREAKAVSWPVWIMAGADALALQLSTVPTTIVYSADGTVLRTHVGALNSAAVDELHRLLSGTLE